MTVSVALYPTGQGRRAPALLATAVILEIALLVVLRALGQHGAVELVTQAALVVTFIALAVADLRVAVAICVLELVVGGASGHWTVAPAGLSGRIILNGILGVISLFRIAQNARGRSIPLGRYGLHAALIAVVVPGIWIPLGLLNGNAPGNAMADGDGFFFFAFALVLAAVATYGDLAWLRRWVLVACMVNALVTVTLAAVLVAGLVKPFQLHALAVGVFDMGGVVGRSDVGALRVALASGLFLQVGVAVVSWELVRGRRRWWPWLSMLLLVAALFVTYTRGYWLGALIAGVVVVVLGRDNVIARASPRVIVAVLLALGALAVVGLIGFSYLDVGAGRSSSEVRFEQARVLLAHIMERPLFGFGFGAIAPDYPFGNTFSYEITYLDRAYKTGIVGLLLFLSLPLRLLFDSVRVWAGRLPGPPHTPAREAAVPLGVIASVLIASATNPYMAGSVGIGAILLCICWLDPFHGVEAR